MCHLERGDRPRSDRARYIRPRGDVCLARGQRWDVCICMGRVWLCSCVHVSKSALLCENALGLRCVSCLLFSTSPLPLLSALPSRQRSSVKQAVI